MLQKNQAKTQNQTRDAKSAEKQESKESSPSSDKSLDELINRAAADTNVKIRRIKGYSKTDLSEYAVAVDKPKSSYIKPSTDLLTAADNRGNSEEASG